jgi:hypothetical protein
VSISVLSFVAGHHCTARTYSETDCPAIVRLYDAAPELDQPGWTRFHSQSPALKGNREEATAGQCAPHPGWGASD